MAVNENFDTWVKDIFYGVVFLLRAKLSSPADSVTRAEGFRWVMANQKLSSDITVLAASSQMTAVDVFVKIMDTIDQEPNDRLLDELVMFFANKGKFAVN